jgi:hypothetical protein
METSLWWQEISDGEAEFSNSKGKHVAIFLSSTGMMMKTNNV